MGASREECIDIVIHVLEGKGLPKQLNETHLVLLPQIDSPELASPFQPIGICNVTYKIISKVFVNCIKPHLPMLISNTQASFVPDRQITHNIVIVQEVLHIYYEKEAKGKRLHGSRNRL